MASGAKPSGIDMKYYLTTPLYYVNSKPHIGHAYTQIAADTLARYKRMQLGTENVHFLTGTDEHGQKIDKAAREAGMPPQEFTDKISLTFRDLWKVLNISQDDFIRTTEDRHKEAVRRVWEKMKDATVDVAGKQEKVLYRHTYDGTYCVPCETFITEGLLDPNHPSLCPDCKRPLEKMKEDTYFFRMSAYQSRLIDDIRQGRLKILPETRRNEVLGFLEHQTLTDLSVSRPKNRLAWGIPIPFDPEHVTYVWLDALVNYISACGYEKNDTLFKKWWPADVHIIGKDIIRHHAVIWPTLLYALDIELPKMIFAHGWWVQSGQKMSKSLGNVTDPNEIVRVYGVDAFRYFLLRETPFGQDGTFNEEALILRCNADLANGLGNLLSRTLTMCEKYFEGQIPIIDLNERLSEKDQSSGFVWSGFASLCARISILPKEIHESMDILSFDETLKRIWLVVERANQFIEETAPWKLAKAEKKDELKYVIGVLGEALRAISQAIWPFMPEKSQAIWNQLGLTGLPCEAPFNENSWGYFKSGGKIAKGQSLFPRIDIKNQ